MIARDELVAMLRVQSFNVAVRAGLDRVPLDDGEPLNALRAGSDD